MGNLSTISWSLELHHRLAEPPEQPLSKQQQSLAGAMGKAPRVYTGAYQDDSDGEGFNLAGAELKACYEVGAPPAPRPRSRAGGGGPPRSGWRSPSGMARTRSREEAGFSRRQGTQKTRGRLP